MQTIYFQPPNINSKYCEVGIILDSDKYYIHYLDEPCKVLLSEVKIIPKEKVTQDKNNRLFKVIP